MQIKEIDVKSVMTKSNLPVSDYSVNPYVGCTHACKYCYASFMKRFTNHPEPWGEFVDVKNWPEIKRPEKYAAKEAFFDQFNTQLTGIGSETVRNAPTFPELWTKIEPLMSCGLLVAHNAVFDMNVLKKCLCDYDIKWKPYARYICTVQMGRRILPGMSHKLNVLCDYYGICLDHHKADSDSRACAEILLRYLEGGADIRQFIRTCSFNK